MCWCKGYKSPATKRFLRRFGIVISLYIVILCALVKFGDAAIKHGCPLYVLAMLMAAPVVGVLIVLGRYVMEETDEYRRLLLVRSLIVASGALLTTSVVNDFLRAFAHWKALPPFISFDLFSLTLAIAQVSQCRALRTDKDE
jgi:hypothetical protein